jgi:hypothetical protein
MLDVVVTGDAEVHRSTVEHRRPRQAQTNWHRPPSARWRVPSIERTPRWSSRCGRNRLLLEVPFSPAALTLTISPLGIDGKGCLVCQFGCSGARQLTRSNPFRTWSGTGFSAQSEPSLSNVQDAGRHGTKFGTPSRVTRSTKSLIACFAAPSLHEAGHRRRYRGFSPQVTSLRNRRAVSSLPVVQEPLEESRRD